jgi:hypothetical protein
MLLASLYTTEKFNTSTKAAKALKLLSTAGPAFEPITFGSSEPVRTPLTAANWGEAIELLSGGEGGSSGGILLKCGKSKSILWIRWSDGREIQNWNLTVPSSYLKRSTFAREFVEYIKLLSGIAPFLFGGASTRADWERKHLLQTDESTMSKQGVDLGPCLPGVYWLTIFGQKLKEYFGAPLAKLQVEENFELKNGASGILLTPRPDSQPNILLERQEAVIKTLGPDYFFDIKQPNKTCKTLSY